jgi:predicted transcriptional regulator|tara:strand:- start:98 stop:331 length:234 start_codon:yes stop_codon:yes gene_type:complete
MPYHIKKASVLGNAVPVGGTEYYAGDNKWTNVYEDRKVYVNESDANAQKATTETRTIGDKTYTYQPAWWKNAIVVSE